MILNGHTVEFLEDEHLYIVDGVIVPSVTRLIKFKFPSMYDGIDKRILNRAAERGNKVHKAIEEYEKLGKEPLIPEMRNYLFLKNYFKWEVVKSESVVIIEIEGMLFCGTLDLLIDRNGKLGVSDIKTTSQLYPEYLKLQLSAYAIGVEQCYDKKVEHLSVIHLRGNKRKFKEIPRDDAMVIDLVKQYKEENIEQSNFNWQTC